MKQMSQGQKYIYEIIVLTSVQASGCQCVQVYHHDISGAAGAARAPCLHCICLQGFTGSLRGKRRAGFSELQGLLVCMHSA